jgi:hypothetical protein
MAIDEKRRQKRLMKKRRKDQARQSKRVVTDALVFASRKNKILQARDFPIFECLINPSWKEDGLATILLSRQQPDGNILFGVYLVDVYCLGLKNTFCNADFPLWKYQTQVRTTVNPKERLVKCPVPLAHGIIYGGIEFASQFGFKPNEDFQLSQYVLEDRNSVEPCEEVEFGKNGQPFYIAGPDDDVEYVMGQLESRVGPRNFKYLYRIGPDTLY